MPVPRNLRRALSVLLACVLAWLPLASVAGLACGSDVAQVAIHAHLAPPGKAPDQNHQVHVCHSVCASCALLSAEVPMLQFVLAQTFNNGISPSLPSPELSVQERPPRFI
jgi:hypothetical protein